MPKMKNKKSRRSYDSDYSSSESSYELPLDLKITDLENAQRAQAYIDRVGDPRTSPKHVTTMGLKFMAVPGISSSSSSSVSSPRKFFLHSKTSGRTFAAGLADTGGTGDYVKSKLTAFEQQLSDSEKGSKTQTFPRPDSEISVLQDLTNTTFPATADINSESYLAKQIARQKEKLKLGERLRVKIYMQNSLLPPCHPSKEETETGARKRPGEFCHYYIPQALTNLKRQYPDVDFRVKVAHYGDYSGVTRYGTDSYEGRIKEKDKNWYK